MNNKNSLISNFLNFISKKDQHYKVWDEDLLFSGTLHAPILGKENILFQTQSSRGIDVMQELYSQSNGLTYHTTVRGDENFGFYFAPVESFQQEKIDMAHWGFSWGVTSNLEEIMNEFKFKNISEIVFNEEVDEILNGEEGDFEAYGGFSSIIVFGGVFCSPNKFFLITRGLLEGSIMYFDHDGGEIMKLAASFPTLLKNLTENKMSRFLNKYI